MEVEQQVARLTEALAGETKRREGAERQAGEISQRRSELESQLTENQQAQAKLQQEFGASQEQLRALEETSRAAQSQFEARIRGLQSAQAAMEQQVRQLTTALTAETARREGVVQEAREIGQRRSELEAELAKHKQAQAELRHELEESQNQFESQRQNYLAEHSKLEARTQEWETVTNELAAARSRIEEKSLHLHKLAGNIAELEGAKAALATQADAARDLIKTHEYSIRSLEVQVRERQGEVDRLESSLQSESAQRRREQLRVEALEQESATLNRQLAEQAAEQQRSHQRESELEQRLRRQTDQLAASEAVATSREAELKSLRSTIDDLRVIESALCSRVRELTCQNDLASQRNDELEGQSRAVAQTIRSRDQELAALRHAILDAARTGDNISRERLQVEYQVVDGWKRLITTLLQTPLSMAQRGVVSEVVCALEGWRKGRADATSGVEFQVDPPDLHQAEFNCAEVIKCALAAVRKSADESGAPVQAALVGAMPERAYGNARQIHQLITLLAGSLPGVGSAGKLELQVSFATVQKGTADLLVSLLLSPTTSLETLCLRLTTFTEATATLRTVRCGGRNWHWRRPGNWPWRWAAVQALRQPPIEKCGCRSPFPSRRSHRLLQKMKPRSRWLKPMTPSTTCEIQSIMRTIAPPGASLWSSA